MEELKPLLRLRWLQLVTLAGLLVAVGVIAFNLKFSVLDLDIWWHLKVGDWMVQHMAVPHNGLFTWTAADAPWVAYSWGYEVLLSRAYAWFGLVGVGSLRNAADSRRRLLRLLDVATSFRPILDGMSFWRSSPARHFSLT